MSTAETTPPSTEDLREIAQLKDDFQQFEKIRDRVGIISNILVYLGGIDTYHGLARIRLGEYILLNDNSYQQAASMLTLHTDDPEYNTQESRIALVKEYYSLKEQFDRFRRFKCRSYRENAWGNVIRRLQSSYPRWARTDNEMTIKFRHVDPGFRDAKEGEITGLVDDNEIIARVTNSRLMAIDFIREFYKHPVPKEGRIGWELITQEAGQWYRRSIFDAGLNEEGNAYIILDSNLYDSYEALPSGVAVNESVTSLGHNVARRLSNSVTRHPHDFKTLPVIDGKIAEESYIVVPHVEK